MNARLPSGVTPLDLGPALWDRCYTVAPLILVGTREENGDYDLAPKHMATALGFSGYFSFVCTPRHHTYGNAEREGAFTVSYPRSSQIVLTSLAAAPRDGESDCKPSVGAIPTFPATTIDGELVEDGYLFLECQLDRIVDGFGEYGLIIGKIVAAHARVGYLRQVDVDDQDLIYNEPLLAYLHPGRFANVDKSLQFPLPDGYGN